MSDEEQEAVEWLKRLVKINKRDNLDDTFAEILLNLIEKQSKEIEHQKEKRENQKKELAILNAKQIEFNKLVNTINSYKGQFKRQQKEIEELKEENKKYIVQLTDEQYRRLVDIIRDETSKEWEDKIKAKIEEYENYGMIEIKAVLQSLLEKEE